MAVCHGPSMLAVTKPPLQAGRASWRQVPSGLTLYKETGSRLAGVQGWGRLPTKILPSFLLAENLEAAAPWPPLPGRVHVLGATPASPHLPVAPGGLSAWVELMKSLPALEKVSTSPTRPVWFLLPGIHPGLEGPMPSAVPSEEDHLQLWETHACCRNSRTTTVPAATALTRWSESLHQSEV